MNIVLPSNNKTDTKPIKSFYKLIESVVVEYQFEVASESNISQLKFKLCSAISKYFPKVYVEGNIDVDFSSVNYTPTLNISKQLINEMELYYPEAMI